MGYFSKEEWNRANAHFRIETPQKLSDDLRTTVRDLTFLTQDAKMVRFTSILIMIRTRKMIRLVPTFNLVTNNCPLSNNGKIYQALKSLITI